MCVAVPMKVLEIDEMDPETAAAILAVQDAAEIAGLAGQSISAYSVVRSLWSPFTASRRSLRMAFRLRELRSARKSSNVS